MRQWVVTIAPRVRGHLARDPKLASEVLARLVRDAERSSRHTAADGEVPVSGGRLGFHEQDRVKQGAIDFDWLTGRHGDPRRIGDASSWDVRPPRRTSAPSGRRDNNAGPR